MLIRKFIASMMAVTFCAAALVVSNSTAANSYSTVTFPSTLKAVKGQVLTGVEKQKIGSITFELNKGETRAVSFQMVSNVYPETSAQRLMETTSIGCFSSVNNTGSKGTTGTQNVYKDGGHKSEIQFLFTATGTGKQTCNVYVKATPLVADFPIPEFRISGATFVSKVNLTGTTSTIEGGKLKLVRPGAPVTVFTSTIEPKTPDAPVAWDSQIKLTACTIVSGSRDNANDKHACPYIKSKPGASKVGVTQTLSYRTADNVACGTPTVKKYDLHISRLEHHEMFSGKLESKKQSTPGCGAIVVATTTVEATTWVPFVAHANQTASMLYTKA